MVAQSTARQRPTLLLTRPEEGGARFADAARARFGAAFDLVVAPLLVPAFLSPDLPTGARGVIFTSPTGVAAFARLTLDRTLPAWCVGTRTAEVARDAGFLAEALGGNAVGLCAALIARRPPAPLIHARGVDVTGDIAQRLGAAGLLTVEVVVYAQVFQPLTVAAEVALRGVGPVVAPLFSPRSARLMVDAAAQATAPIWVVAMSRAVADAAAPLSPARMVVADAPTAAAMLDAIGGLNAASA